MTATTINTLSIISSIACFILPAWQLITNKKKKGLNKITAIGWLCICVAIYMSITGFLGIAVAKRDNEVSKKERSDDKKEIITSIESALNKYNLHYDTGKKEITIIKVDSSNFYGVPNVELADYPNGFGVSYTKNRDSLKYDINLFNFSKTDAYNLKIKLYSLYVCGKSTFYSKVLLLEDSKDIIAGKGYHYTAFTTELYRCPPIDTVYSLIKITSSNYFKKTKKEFSELLFWSFSDNKYYEPNLQRRKDVRKIMLEKEDF